jgi:hypothetical protein
MEQTNSEKLKKDGIIQFKNEDGYFYIIQDFSFDLEDIKNLFPAKDSNSQITIIVDINKLSKNLESGYKDKIVEIFRYLEGNKLCKNLRIIYKNCLVESNINMYIKNEKLNSNLLYISDELYSISVNLSTLFSSFSAKILILKKIKINSQKQLQEFFSFISNSSCEELILEDIFIELILKNKSNENDYNVLNKYFFYENGVINIKDVNTVNNNTKIKKLKMIDCPLFAIKKDTFKNIKDYKDISIDIDENSLVNPSIITKFKIEKGCTDICFDLDSLKVNEEDEKDYIDYIKYVFNMIIDDNYNYNKIIFKNFDVTKHEYISGENLTFIEEKNWIFNKEEKERKEKFEMSEKEIDEIINSNLDKLQNLKELTFDNCSNHFIKSVLKLVSKNKELNYLKVKKCGKEYFDLNNILFLHINNLILFDTPLIIDHFPENEKSHLECFKGTLGKVDNLTININTLEHYCISNNLDYYRTIEILVELINDNNFNQNICFEMDALPIIMTFLVAKKYNENRKENEKYIIPENFNFSSFEERQNLIENDSSAFILKGLENKTITIKRGNIKNRLENYYVIISNMKKEEKSRIQKIDFGRDLFDIDIDYNTFFIKNKLNSIIFKETTFSNNMPLKIREDFITPTLINLLLSLESDDIKEFKIDIKTLNDAIYKNIYGDAPCLIREYIAIMKRSEVNNEQFEAFKLLMNFITNLKNIFEKIKNFNGKITFVFDNLKEKKHFYCLLYFLREINLKINYQEKTLTLSHNKKPFRFMVPDKNNNIKNNMRNYFIEEENEDKQKVFGAFNYYYSNKEEMELFGESEINKEIIFDDYKFKIEYSCNSKKSVYEKDGVKNKLFNQMIFE